jgi:hypothetical protein
MVPEILKSIEMMTISVTSDGGTAAKPLQRAIEDHLAEAGGGGAQRAGAGKAERGDHEHDTGR